MRKGSRLCGSAPLVCALVVSLVAALTHEPWIDEIYAWQISKFTIRGIFHEMRYEGHFALWSLVLSPFSRLGLPLKTLGLVSWTINALTMVYFFRRAPFRTWAKSLVLFTLPFIYLNPAISRCYVLIPLLLFPMATVFTRMASFAEHTGRERNGFIAGGALLALFANTHVYSEGFALAYGVMMLRFACAAWGRSSRADRARCLIGLAVGLLGALVALLQVAPSLTHSAVFADGGGRWKLSDVGNLLQFLSGAGITEVRVALLAAAAFALVAVYLARTDLRSFLLLALSTVYMGAVCVFVYGAGVPNRAVMWFYFVIFSLWITNDRLCGREFVRRHVEFLGDIRIAWGRGGALAVPSLLLAVMALFLVQPGRNLSDFRQLYGGEARFAYFIRDAVPRTEPLFCNPNPWSCAIMEYLPGRRFFNVKDGSPLVPRADRKPLDDGKAAEYIHAVFEGNPDKEFVYVIDSDVYNGKTSFIQRGGLPFEHEVLYPQDERQEDYFIQYFLIRVWRPTEARDAGRAG